MDIYFVGILGDSLVPRLHYTSFGHLEGRLSTTAPPCRVKGVEVRFAPVAMRIYILLHHKHHCFLVKGRKHRSSQVGFISQPTAAPHTRESLSLVHYDITMPSISRTFLAFQHDSALHKIEATVLLVYPFSALDEPNRDLFKFGCDQDHVVVTERTIYHPQGGGQPSDEGTMTAKTGLTFTVTSVRMDAVRDGQVLHLGRFANGDATRTFTTGETVEQAVNAEKRLLYSRLHTAGHILGASVRHIVKDEVEGFLELKASHFPGAAACEFQGLIDGKWKDVIQKKVDESIAAKLPVSVEWWDENDFHARGLEHLLPDSRLVALGEKFRMVNIGGLDVYPCGGTHVETTDLCGHTTVKKITRKQGRSKVSYSID